MKGERWGGWRGRKQREGMRAEGREGRSERDGEGEVRAAGRRDLRRVYSPIPFLPPFIFSLLLCRDEEGLRVFYYLVQDLKCLVFSLIGLHFKIKPI